VREHADWTLARDALAHLALRPALAEGWNEYLGATACSVHPIPSRHFAAARRWASRAPAREQGIGDVLFFLRSRRCCESGPPCSRSPAKRSSIRCSEQRALEEVREARPDDADNPRFDSRLWVGDLPALLECSETPGAWRFSLGEGEQKCQQRLAALGRPVLP